MNLVKCGKISCVQPKWSKNLPLVAGVTTRNGGLSRPPYNSLNLGMNTGDAAYNVEGNRSTFLHEFDLPLHHLLLVEQVHGDDVLVVNSKNHDVSHFQDVKADAIVSNQAGLMLGMLVADCYPVLMIDKQKQVIAVVHVGWRGAANGILDKTVTAMVQEFGCDVEQIKVMVGPGIGAAHYQVGKDVREAFRSGSGNWNKIAEEAEFGSWHLDIQHSIELQLLATGILKRHCELTDLCTWEHRELFFSYRRDDGDTGRQLGFIMLPNGE